MNEDEYINQLETVSTEGSRDITNTDMFRLEDMMFCDIPYYLQQQTPIDEKVLPYFDEVLQKLEDNALNEIDRIVDFVKPYLPEIPDEDNNLINDENIDEGDSPIDNKIECEYKDNPSECEYLKNDDEENCPYLKDKNDKDSPSGQICINCPYKDKIKNKEDENSDNEPSASDSSTNIADELQDEGSKDVDSTDDNNENEKIEDSKKISDASLAELVKPYQRNSAIIEFACDTTRYEHENYIWNVEPGETITSDTILAYCKQHDEMVPVKSIFSKGIVRKDENDGDFWRCWKTVSSRHIVIDDVEVDIVPSVDGVDLQYLSEDPSIFINLADDMQSASEIFDLINLYFPYVLYLKLIANFGREIKSTPIPEERIYPEEIFEKFIKKQYIPLRDSLPDKVLKVYGTKKDVKKRMKKTKGNIKKLRQMANEVVQVKHQHFLEMTDLIENFNSFCEDYHFQSGREETYKFFKTMDFELDVLEDDEIEVVTGDELVRLKEGSAFDGEDFSEYFNRIDKCIYNNKNDLVVEFKDLLKKIVTEMKLYMEAKESVDNPDISVSDNLTNVRKWIEELDNFYLKCKDIYDENAIKNIPEDIYADSGEDESKMQKILKKAFPKIAEWPTTSKEYYYEPTNETFGYHYTFLNIDAFETKEDEIDEIDDETEDEELEAFLDNLTEEGLADDIAKKIEELENLAVYDGNAEDDYEEVPNFEEQTKLKSPTIFDLKYWLKYFGIATLSTMMFLATGIVLPTGTIPLPCIYIPFLVVNIKKVGLIMVIGISVRGMAINPIILIVNVDSKDNSYLIPVTMALQTLKETIQNKILPMLDMAALGVGVASNLMKSSQIEMLKKKKERGAKKNALKNVVQKGKQSIKDKFKTMFNLPKTRSVKKCDESPPVSNSID